MKKIFRESKVNIDSMDKFKITITVDDSNDKKAIIDNGNEKIDVSKMNQSIIDFIFKTSENGSVEIIKDGDDFWVQPSGTQDFLSYINITVYIFLQKSLEYLNNETSLNKGFKFKMGANKLKVRKIHASALFTASFKEGFIIEVDE